MSTVVLHEVEKSYRLFSSERDRLLEFISGRPRHRRQESLHPLTLQIGAGEVVGIMGVNGAGKSTLLKLIAGTLSPTRGAVEVTGKVCALLELGSGFHPEMSGLDNIYLGGAVVGLSTQEIESRLDAIIDFSGLRPAIHQPVKTYSSGMLTRLAFSVATSVDPDVLILDEILSVGDGRFASKSFERILGFKESGKTILFCSHSPYQVQAICSRVLWLDQGRLRMDGPADRVVAAYTDFLNASDEDTPADSSRPVPVEQANAGKQTAGAYRLRSVEVAVDGERRNPLQAQSGASELSIRVMFDSDPSGSAPCVGMMLVTPSGRTIASASTLNDKFDPRRDPQGRGGVILRFPKLPLLKGSYWVNVFLLCDQGLMVHDKARMVAEVVVHQHSLEQGVVSLPRQWSND